MGWKWCQQLVRWIVFWYNVDPRCQEKAQPTTPRTVSFVTLAPKPDFHLHCDQPQHETHNLQHTLSEWFCGCFGIPLKNQCLRMLFLYSTQGSDKICQKPSEIYITKLHSTHLPFCKTPATATNARTKAPIYKLRGRRCSRRMAHSDPPPPARRGQGVPDSLQTLTDLTDLQTPKALRGPRLCRRPLPPNRSFHTSASFSQIFFIFLPLKNSSKFGPLSNPPQISQIGPLGTQS